MFITFFSVGLCCSSPKPMDSIETNKILSCALSGDIEGLMNLYSDAEDPDHVHFKEMLEVKDTMGRSILSQACMLGRYEVVRELVKCGANVNEKTERGYSPLHYAAIWGQMETLKTLLDLGANILAISFNNEKARDAALRYSKMECANYLELEEARQALASYIANVRSIIADPEKVQGKLNKDDKNTTLNLCLSKSDWMQNAKNPTVQDFLEQKKQLEDALIPVFTKLTAEKKSARGEKPSKS
ncbi:ankyrin repeat domain-containing protein 45 isoform X1 [Polypterus senegalus]|uniref:ankyrin repeat domain-containing protein 45 isoform X1 n=2 Tax=Polypterus senegalus TaxID=55291 RepID=UPI0019644F32|nr:ankyrin repeat domain-containing protein 45 isoform X1 [Polypterus senegalus]